MVPLDKWWYRLTCGSIAKAQSPRIYQAIVSLRLEIVPLVVRRARDGTASTPKIKDEILFGSIFEVLEAYKYPTLSCMKEHEK